ncbi:MAG: beta-lactamase family protein [Candidatus Aminicenantes bacterium]|nr:beta-lactamase family protein [Candidatus Aminicenantes bacterium]TFG57011.1 MAG: class A beta-lactamase-related serine hydrolase [Candidatus Aminicenantes bacterium]
MNVRLKLVTLITAAALIIAGNCNSRSTSENPVKDPAQIQAVENALRPAAYIKGKPIAAMNILDRMKHYHIPGVSVAVIDNGKIAWAKGYGVKEAGGHDPVTPETLFQAASISKPVAALGTLRLVDKGILDLDSPVNDTLVSWKVPENEFSEKEKVTLRRLLTHSAGLTVSGFPGYATSEQIPTPVQVLNGEKPANTPPVRIDMIPGSQWRYSGGGFVVTQLLVADVSGRPFQEYMKATVLDPLGMNHSTFEQPLPQDKADQAASGHEMNGEAVKGRWHVYPELGAAGLWTTPSDLCRLAIELQKSFTGESNQIISQEMTVRMLTPGTGNWGLGIGLSTTTTEGEKSFSHGGGNKGFICMLFAYIHKGQGAVVMTNSDNGNQLVLEILRGLSSVYGWSVLQPKEVALVEIVPEKLTPYVGDYRAADEPDTPVLVSIEKNQLHIKSPEIGDWALSPLSETEFVYMDGGVFITFVKGTVGSYDQIKTMGQVFSRKK